MPRHSDAGQGRASRSALGKTLDSGTSPIRTTVARFAIDCERFIGADGAPVGALPDFARDRDQVTALYRAMVLTRTFNVKAVAPQRTGRLVTYASSLGQKAVGVIAAAVMLPQDVLLASFAVEAGMAAIAAA